MKRISAVSFKRASTVLAGLLCLTVTSYARAEMKFLRSLEVSNDFSTLSVAQKKSDRYMRLMANVSVFAIYCDMSNTAGLNQTVSKFRQRVDSLGNEASTNFGAKVAYNRFEKMRNEASLYFVSQSAEEICAREMNDFKSVTQLGASEVEAIVLK